MKIEVIKWKDRDPKDNVIYIGRGSPLGNPFKIGQDGTREEVCEKYREYFERKVILQNSPINLEIRTIMALAKLDKRPMKLGCFCAPQQCHGDIIKWYLEGILNN